MDLRFNEAQEVLRKTAREFLATECPKSLVRRLEEDGKGFSPELWRQMADLGWMGMFLPEEYDGMGMTFQDFTILLEEVGRNIMPLPYLSTMVSTFPILEGGTKEQKRELLPKIARGDLVLALAFLEADGAFGPSGIAAKATPQGDGFVINGKKLFVEMAHIANYLLCAVRTKKGASAKDGVSLFIVDAKSPGIECQVIPTIGLDKLCEVRFKNVSVPQKNLLGKLDQGWPLLQKTLEKGAIAKCAESIGATQACVEMAVAYSKERVQYDHPIGAFQALQHYMADMWITMETAMYLTYEVAWMASEGLPCSKEVSMVKAYVNEAYKDVSKRAVRVHGGIGTTRDHDIGLYYRRAKAADTVFGSTDYHRELVAHQIGLR